MLYITINNKYAYLRGMTPRLTKRLEKITSYLVSGFMFSPKFKAHRWDGREHLMSFVPQKGYRIPSGLVSDVVKELKESDIKYKIKCEYKRNGPKIQYNWNPKIVLRDYQNEAVGAICKGKKWERGSGLLKMPIRSGKTKTAAGIIHKLKKRTLFIVPSQMLLYQTKESLEESLSTEIGIIGDGNWDIKDCTVATVQTLGKHSGGVKKIGPRKKRIVIPPDEKFKSISNFFDLVIFDESHHLAGDVWHAIVMGFDCRHKLGLSASIHLEDIREWGRGVIWLKACCGNIRYEVSPNVLVEQGYLLKQNIELVIQNEPTGKEKWKWGKELLNTLIYENEFRNSKIVDKAIEKTKEGLKVLVVSNRLNQLSQLHKMMKDKNTKHEIVTGRDRTSSRKDKVKSFLSGDVNILMGTVFGEGIDIPEVECVINAEGGRDIKTTIQRMRNMTPASGKTKAVFIDFMDVTNKHFAKHSLERLKIYKEEPAFDIKIIE
jgi:superfamily II DNA or RNA helicase